VKGAGLGELGGLGGEASQSYKIAILHDATQLAPPPALPIPTEAGKLVAHVRDILHCRLTLENDELTVRPNHRCPPAVLAALIAVWPEVVALIAPPPS
jgi:hypothetical protein